ncbi:hypothetical protein BJ508DRAFT_314774 [Ascobolus immersus RN42]|uniref:Uncharacterized protein n=1 Tax=Ascobolus immersus RN42 TaxID=1160509 RepID=A0A3N4HFN1_ASCIM|nr:hypothetical protein BJ508DRAFT_314774 [Ascobolus immersus RN42]
MEAKRSKLIHEKRQDEHQIMPKTFTCPLCEVVIHDDNVNPEKFRQHVYNCSLPDNPPVSAYNLPKDHIFDENGDLMLAIYDFDAGTQEGEEVEPSFYLVSSTVLKRSSKVLASMLDKGSAAARFTENKIILRQGYPGILDLLEDSGVAWKFILAMLHCDIGTSEGKETTSGMRRNICEAELEYVHKIALLVDKYLIKREKFQSVIEYWQKQGCNSWPQSEAMCEETTGFLTVSWVFAFDGLRQPFNVVATFIILNSVKYEDGLRMPGKPKRVYDRTSDFLFRTLPPKEIYQPEWKALPSCTPSSLVDYIERIREKYFSDTKAFLEEIWDSIIDIDTSERKALPGVECSEWIGCKDGSSSKEEKGKCLIINREKHTRFMAFLKKEIFYLDTQPPEDRYLSVNSALARAESHLQLAASAARSHRYSCELEYPSYHERCFWAGKFETAIRTVKEGIGRIPFVVFSGVPSFSLSKPDTRKAHIVTLRDFPNRLYELYGDKCMGW